MQSVIYADNAATTKLDIDAFDAMKPYLLEVYGNPSQPYFFSRKPKLAVKEARKVIAKCINAEPEEIFFTSGGTESDNWAIKDFGISTDIKHIITSSIEHHAVLNACKNQQMEGVDVQYLPVDSGGVVSAKTLEEVLSIPKEHATSCETTLVSIMFANNEIGTIEPIKELVKVAHNHGAYFHTDAVQAVGHVAIDVKELGVDMLSASAHKFNGPKGIGFLYIRKGVIIQPHNDGGAQEFGKRAGTENVAAIVGMATALKKNVEQCSFNCEYLNELENKFFEELDHEDIDYVRNGSDNRLPGNISLSIKGADGEGILHRLDLLKICISTGSACDSVNTQVSHVIKAIGLSDEYAEGTIRISFGKENTLDDALEIARAIKKVILK